MENSCISRTVSAIDFRLGSAYCLGVYSCLIFIQCVRCTIPSYRTARSLYSHPNIDDFRHQLQEPLVPTQRKDTNIGMQTWVELNFKRALNLILQHHTNLPVVQTSITYSDNAQMRVYMLYRTVLHRDSILCTGRDVH